MKVILLENIKRIGSIGEIKKLKRGFARNFLIANKKALYASKENIAQLKKLNQNLQKKIMKRKKISKDTAEKINTKSIQLKS